MDRERHKLQDIVDKSLISLGIEVGIAAGIYKAFEKHNRKCTCEELAKTAGLNERYVKEWLGGMIAAELIYLNEESEYILPISAEAIESQCKTSLMRILFGHFDHVIDAMKNVGKSGYELYDVKGLAEFMAIERQRPGSIFYIDSNFVKDNIAPVVKWVKEENDVSIKIMDFGCGNGIVTIQIAKYLSDVNIVGIDENNMIIERAKKSAQDENVPNCLFEVCKGEDLTENYDGSFDIVLMMDVLHDLADPDHVMASVKNVLKPGGYLIAIDPAMHSDHRDNVGNIAVGGYYFVSMFVCLPSSLTRDPKAGHGLGWGYENRKSYIEKCGFRLCTLTEEEDVNEMKKRIIGKMM